MTDAAACYACPADRRKLVGPVEEVSVWTRFDFPGRSHGSFRWNHAHFTGVDYDDLTQRKAIWLLHGKTWADDVSTEFGNFDYLSSLAGPSGWTASFESEACASTP